MRADITVGQYCEGNSFLHRLNPKWKVLFAVVYITVIFLCKNVYSFLLLFLFTAALIAGSRINLKVFFRGLKSVIAVIAITALINIFWLRGETEILHLGFIHIYLEGVINAVLIVVRVVLLITGTSLLLTYTTTPIALTDGIEQFLAPLAKIKLPVHEFSMMMTIALRFIPTLIEETDKIMSAQKARGSDFSNGPLMKRAKALIPILVPLFISAFRRAGDLATAMECRCYRGGDGRTRMNILRSTWRDAVMLLMLCALCTGVVLVNKYAPGYKLSM